MLGRRTGRQERRVVGVDRTRQRRQQENTQPRGDQPAGDHRVTEADRAPGQAGHEVFHHALLLRGCLRMLKVLDRTAVVSRKESAQAWPHPGDACACHYLPALFAPSRQ